MGFADLLWWLDVLIVGLIWRLVCELWLVCVVVFVGWCWGICVLIDLWVCWWLCPVAKVLVGSVCCWFGCLLFITVCRGVCFGLWLIGIAFCWVWFACYFWAALCWLLFSVLRLVGCCVCGFVWVDLVDWYDTTFLFCE